MKEFIRTYRYSVLVVAMLTMCLILGIGQRAEAVEGVCEEVSEVKTVKEVANTSGPCVPAERVITARVEEKEVEEEKELDAATELEDEHIIQSEVIENSGSVLTAEPIPTEVQEIVKTATTTSVSINGYTDVNEYAIACGYDFEQERTETIYDVFSEEELEYAFRMVETEVRGGPFTAKVNVAEALFCRYTLANGSSSLKALVTSPNQFAYHRTDISQETIWAVEYAYQYISITNNCRYFKRGGGDTWYGCPLIYVDEVGHHFYGEPAIVEPEHEEEILGVVQEVM